MPSVLELLERVPFLAALPAREREALAGVVKRRRFGKGQVIFHKDDPGQSLFIIAEGAVSIYLPSPQGADLVLALLGAGDFFGDLALLDGELRTASAAAVEETETLVLLREEFLRLVTSRPEAVLAVLSVVTHRLREADEMAGDLAFLDVGGRLAKKLLELAAAHGVPGPQGVLLDVPLTQEELASMVGVTRESVNRHLALFRRLGLVDSEGRRFVLLDPEALQRRIT